MTKQQRNGREWAGTTYGNSLMHKWLVKLLRVIDIRIVYAFTAVFVIPPCMFLPGFRFIYRYFRERRGMGRMKAFCSAYRNHCLFGQVVIDRFAIYGGKRFRVDIDGGEYYDTLASREEAFIQLSAHVGNYELAGYSLKASKSINALVFDGEKQTVMENRTKIFADRNIRMIAVREDMSHLYEIERAIRSGEIVSMPADRMFGSQKSVVTSLLGAPVRLPLGPFAVATSHGLEVLAVNVMKRGATRYKIYVRPLHYDRQAPRRVQTAQLAQAYAKELERMLEMYPTQWYNYYNVWCSE